MIQVYLIKCIRGSYKQVGLKNIPGFKEIQLSAGKIIVMG
jgi:hypothetical protein